MATFLGQTTHISLLIILLATTTLVHASKYRILNANTPSLPFNLQKIYNHFRRSPVFRKPANYYPQLDKATFLAIHNAARASVGLPPMTWDDKVAAFAQKWANQRKNDCRLVHSGSEEYGENIFWGGGDFSVAFAVGSWVSERKYYDVYSNFCGGGMDCGHWTQMVWRTSTRLGCARVRCSNGGVFVTCNYDPPGNYIGVRPY